jgi:hypothetical protein
MNQTEGVDYICLVDDLALPALGWDVRLMPQPGLPPASRCRWAKFHPHHVFPRHTASIYVDGNIEIIGDLAPLLRILVCHPIAMYEHPFRRCSYAEAIECELIGFDKPERICQQFERYRVAGFPRDLGLFEANVILRTHRDPALMRAMDRWWAEWQSGVKRDQLSLTYALWREGLAAKSLGPNDARSIHEYFRYHPHLGPAKGSVLRRLRGLTNRIRRRIAKGRELKA